MHELKSGESDILSLFRPDSWLGALLYLACFIVIALVLTRVLRAGVHAAMTRKGHTDVTGIHFLQQLGTALIWVIALILYAHLVPVLRSMGTALLAGASIASVVIGLAAQSTLGNLIAGIAITIYRPFRLGERLQVATPTGTEVGTVEQLSLGYTTLRTTDNREIVLPNSVAASQVMLNLSRMKSASRISITIRVSRSAPLADVRHAVRRAARAVVPDSAIKGCHLKSIESKEAVVVLTIDIPAAEDPDTIREKLISTLAAQLGSAAIDGLPLDGISLD